MNSDQEITKRSRLLIILITDCLKNSEKNQIDVIQLTDLISELLGIFNIN